MQLVGALRKGGARVAVWMPASSRAWVSLNRQDLGLGPWATLCSLRGPNQARWSLRATGWSHEGNMGSPQDLITSGESDAESRVRSLFVDLTQKDVARVKAVLEAPLRMHATTSGRVRRHPLRGDMPPTARELKAIEDVCCQAGMRNPADLREA